MSWIDTSVLGDNDLIDFDQVELSLFAAAISLAVRGKPTTYHEAMLGDALERGADQILQKLRNGEWTAIGVDPVTMIPEVIPLEAWESAHYNPPLFSPSHTVDFIERDRGDPDGKPVGLGGTLHLYDNSKRWFRVRIKKEPTPHPAPELPTPVAEVTSVQSTEDHRSPPRKTIPTERRLRVFCDEIVRAGERVSMEAAFRKARDSWSDTPRQMFREVWQDTVPNDWRKKGPFKSRDGTKKAIRPKS